MMFIASEIAPLVFKWFLDVAQLFFLEKLYLKMPNIFRIGLEVAENEPLKVGENLKIFKIYWFWRHKINEILDIVFINSTVSVYLYSIRKFARLQISKYPKISIRRSWIESNSIKAIYIFPAFHFVQLKLLPEIFCTPKFLIKI